MCKSHMYLTAIQVLHRAGEQSLSFNNLLDQVQQMPKVQCTSTQLSDALEQVLLVPTDCLLYMLRVLFCHIMSQTPDSAGTQPTGPI